MNDCAEWPLRFVVVAEDVPDFDVAKILAERVLTEQVEWLEDQTSAWKWTGLSSSDSFLKWIVAHRLASKAGIRVYGFSAGSPNGPDALAARKALALVRHSEIEFGPVSAVFLIRDLDKQQERVHGLNQGRSHGDHAFKVIIGTPNPMREAWHLLCYVPKSEDEKTLLTQERTSLGFDPTKEAHKLTASSKQAKRSAKRVLNTLTNGCDARAEDDMRQADLNNLRQIGGPTCLADFLEELINQLPNLYGASVSNCFSSSSK